MTIIVPYRNRQSHLHPFLPRIEELNPEARVVVVEQFDDKVFNRGKLLNIGFMEYSDDDFFCMHDVDMLPVAPIPECREFTVTQLASSDIQYVDYLGGVTVFHRPAFLWANGYPNDFYRAEDNAMMFTLKKLGIPVVTAPQQYEMLNHERPALEFDPLAWHAAQHRDRCNGLSTCSYGFPEMNCTEPAWQSLRVLT